jgi:hypothetical protein
MRASLIESAMLFMRRARRACVFNEHEPFTNLSFRTMGPAVPPVTSRCVMA